MKIFVTDGNGITGKAVIRELVRLGAEVYGLVSDDVLTNEIEELGGRSLIGDVRDEYILEKGIKAADRIYHVCPPWLLDEVEVANKIIKISQGCDISLLGYHSVMTPHIESLPSHWNKMQVQMLLMKSHLPFTVIQPAMYMQSLFNSMIEQMDDIKFELLYKPDAQISWVDIDDVAEAVASILTRPYHLGGTYELCGTDIPISCINIVKEIGDLSKKKIKFTNMPYEKIKNGLSKNKYNAQQLSNQKLYYDFINENRMRAGNSKVLTMLLQRPPNSFKRAFKRKYQP
jgi:uncharacterized protein YbjT (DUF2867 family)